MSNEDKTPPQLSADEIAEIRAMLVGRRSMRWLFQNARGVAVWVLAITGAWAVFHEWITSTILRISQGPG